MPAAAHPYLAGAILGVVLFLAFLLTGNGLGSSGATSRIDAWLVDLVAPAHVDQTPYLLKMAGGERNPLDDWIVPVFFGALLGGFASGARNGRLGLTTTRGPNQEPIPVPARTARGLPKEKIVMGLPFYGDPNLPYFKIVAEDPSAAQTDTFDYFGTTFHYNGIPTVQAKTKLATEQASGIMFWTLDFDAQGELSLVNTIYQTAYP